LCTTEQLISLDNRQNEVHLEVTMMAGNAIAGLLVDIRKRQSQRANKCTHSSDCELTNLLLLNMLHRHRMAGASVRIVGAVGFDGQLLVLALRLFVQIAASLLVPTDLSLFVCSSCFSS
jgi:hypothetical protein